MAGNGFARKHAKLQIRNKRGTTNSMNTYILLATLGLLAGVYGIAQTILMATVFSQLNRIEAKIDGEA